MITTRWSSDDDCPELAALHGEAWRYTYAGIIPGRTLERMIGRRGPRWWRHMNNRGAPALLIEVDGRIVGYATIGPVRTRTTPRTGEIYEIYIRPEYHGTGLGQRLFTEARRRLSDKGLTRLVVWSLAANEIGCRFYRALGGKEAARSTGNIGGAPLAMIGFAWT